MDTPLTLAEFLPKAKVITVLAGAGTSTGGGIPGRPAAGLCPEAAEHGARLMIINAGETPYDGPADAVLRPPAGEALPRPARLALGGGR